MRIARLLGRVQAFAQHCYETRDSATLEAALSQRDADADDCAAWGLSPGDWFIAVAVALSERDHYRPAEEDAL
jgi:hypothetical protein